MSRWRRSVDELTVRRQHKRECERAQEALSRVTSGFQQLAASLGSSADGSFLRDELEDKRVLAHRICTGKNTWLHTSTNLFTCSYSCLSLTCLQSCLGICCVSCQNLKSPP